MVEFRFILEKGSKRFTCPNCGKQEYKRYIDTLTGEYLPKMYGRCNREEKCGYHLNPYKDGYKPEKTPLFAPLVNETIQEQEKLQENIYIPPEALKNLQKTSYFDKCTFIKVLQGLYGYEKTLKAVLLYRLGATPGGAVCFPFIDTEGQITAIQEKIFNERLHTDKSAPYHTTWTHARLLNELKRQRINPPDWLEKYQKQEKKVRALFGAHLLSKYPNTPVALVEAPKTAIVGALEFGFPDEPGGCVWVAAGAKSWLRKEILKPLAGRTVVVYPDASEGGATWQEWKEKLKAYEKDLEGVKISVSELLENIPDEDKKAGVDLADYLLKDRFKEKEETKTEVRQIAEIIKFFGTVQLPDKEITLTPGVVITDLRLFVKSHIELLRASRITKATTPAAERLLKVKEKLETIKSNQHGRSLANKNFRPGTLGVS